MGSFRSFDDFIGIDILIKLYELNMIYDLNLFEMFLTLDMNKKKLFEKVN